MAENGRILNRVFTRGVLSELIQTGSNDVYDYVVQRHIYDPESKTHGQIISEIYAHLGREKRNEYYYMNTLLNKLLVGVHSVNTTTALSKVRVGKAIADFILINGDGKIYALEVKSELDNFNRLYDQVSNYYKAFSKVSVLSSIHEYNRLKLILSEFGAMGEAVGIYVLSDNNTIFSKKHYREPKLFEEYLDHNSIFKLLRKRDYESILLSQYNEVPNVAPVFYYRACLEKFQKIPIQLAQKLSFAELKKRNKISKNHFEGIQNELRAVMYFSGLACNTTSLERLLQSHYKGVM